MNDLVTPHVEKLIKAERRVANLQWEKAELLALINKHWRLGQEPEDLTRKLSKLEDAYVRARVVLYKLEHKDV